MRGLGGIYATSGAADEPGAEGISVFEIVAIVFAIGCTVALVEWWKGPEIPRR
jgi:hypothetical protein